jgi:hypothetical protein
MEWSFLTSLPLSCFFFEFVKRENFFYGNHHEFICFIPFTKNNLLTISKRNTMGATCGAGTAYPFGAPVLCLFLIFDGVRVAHLWILCLFTFIFTFAKFLSGSFPMICCSLCSFRDMREDQQSSFNGLKINIGPCVKWNIKMQEEFEDTKGVIRQRSTKHSHKTKDRVTQPHKFNKYITNIINRINYRFR